MALSTHLRQFSDNLAPSGGVTTNARQATSRVQDVLHATDGISIDRIVPLGSYAKKTSLGRGFNMDVDLHVFINDEIPPFSSAKNKLATALRRLDPNVKVGSHALKLKVNGIDFDVVPTANFVNKHISVNGSVAEKQIANVLYYLKHKAGPHVDKKREYSTSVSECAVEFEKRHSAFSHAMSRLAKFWGSKVSTQHSPKGNSSIMEYLGARAAESVESFGSQDLLKAFRGFLNMVKQPQNISVYWEYFYKKSDIAPTMMKQRPLLLDPSNPYDNFFQGVSQTYYNDLRRFAEDTLVQLETAERNGSIPTMFRDVGTRSVGG